MSDLDEIQLAAAIEASCQSYLEEKKRRVSISEPAIAAEAPVRLALSVPNFFVTPDVTLVGFSPGALPPLPPDPGPILVPPPPSLPLPPRLIPDIYLPLTPPLPLPPIAAPLSKPPVSTFSQLFEKEPYSIFKSHFRPVSRSKTFFHAELQDFSLQIKELALRFDNSEFMCPICHCVIEDAVSNSSCGHSYCSACIQTEMESERGRRCPVCRGDITSLSRIVAFRSLLEAQERICSNCPFFGTVSKMKYHLSAKNPKLSPVCPDLVGECFGCRKSMTWKAYQIHELSCRNNCVECKYDKEFIHISALRSHSVGSCERPLVCVKCKVSFPSHEILTHFRICFNLEWSIEEFHFMPGIPVDFYDRKLNQFFPAFILQQTISLAGNPDVAPESASSSSSSSSFAFSTPAASTSAASASSSSSSSCFAFASSSSPASAARAASPARAASASAEVETKVKPASSSTEQVRIKSTYTLQCQSGLRIREVEHIPLEDLFLPGSALDWNQVSLPFPTIISSLPLKKATKPRSSSFSFS